MPSPSQALELENFLPYRLSILAQIVSESLHDLYAEPFGLTVTQWRVMAALGRFAPLTASDVGQRIVMDKVAVSRAVAGLMKLMEPVMIFILGVVIGTIVVAMYLPMFDLITKIG